MSFQVEGDRIPVAREGELYSLKWHTFQTHLTAGLKQFLLDGEFLTDVTLVAEGKMIRSHRMLLSLCSPHFKQLFQGNSAANTNTIVILNNVRYQDLQHVIQFIYNGEVKVSNNHELQGFLQTGELLQIEGLTKAGTNNETEGQEPQGPGRVSPVTQSTPTPGMNRRSHQQVPQGTARTGSHIQNVTSNASSLIGDTKIKPQQKLSIPSTSQSSHHAPPAKRTRLATASATVTSATTKYDVSNDNSITGDLNQSAEGMSEIDPLSVSGMQQRDPLMEESGVDPDLEEEQMITIDSIKSETVVDDGSLGMYGERSDDDGTFELTEHGEHSGLGVEDVYGGGALGVDDMNLAGPSSALSGASGSNAGVLSKPPVSEVVFATLTPVKLSTDNHPSHNFAHHSSYVYDFDGQRREQKPESSFISMVENRPFSDNSFSQSIVNEETTFSATGNEIDNNPSSVTGRKRIRKPNHQTIGPVSCDICGKLSKNKNSLKTHRSLYHRNELTKKSSGKSRNKKQAK